MSRWCLLSCLIGFINNQNPSSGIPFRFMETLCFCLWGSGTSWCLGVPAGLSPSCTSYFRPSLICSQCSKSAGEHHCSSAVLITGQTVMRLTVHTWSPQRATCHWGVIHSSSKKSESGMLSCDFAYSLYSGDSQSRCLSVMAPKQFCFCIKSRVVVVYFHQFTSVSPIS